MYILKPPAAGILYTPLFYTPPTPRGVFSGVGGWGCIKCGHVTTLRLNVFLLGDASLLTVGVFLLTVELVCLQSASVLIRQAFLL